MLFGEQTRTDQVALASQQLAEVQQLIRRAGVRNVSVVGIALATAGLVLLAGVPVHGTYVADLLHQMLPALQGDEPSLEIVAIARRPGVRVSKFVTSFLARLLTEKVLAPISFLEAF